jgi:carbon monoxide dehydrogenase subunit G
MVHSRHLLALVAATAIAAGCAGEAPPPRSAAAETEVDALTPQQVDALHRGDHVAFPREFERLGGRYVGGVAYQIVEAPPHLVLDAVRDPSQLRRILPRARSVTRVDADGPQRFVVEQGNDWVQAEYTVTLEESPTRDEIRFFLDATRPHDVEDVYGFFRVEPLGQGHTLVSMGVALDLGPGLVRMLFEKRVQALMLETPRLMRDVVESQSAQDLLARRDLH